LPNKAFAENIYISEILPNPEGTDSNKEWIELFNPTSREIDLTDWKIQNKKTHIIENTSIKPNSTLTLTNLQINLKNTEDSIKLLNPANLTIDEITYPSAPAQKSYSKISIQSTQKTTHKWEWADPTKNAPNQILYEITGEILSPPSLNSPFLFTINDKKIHFNPQKYQPQLLKTLFKKTSEIQLLAEKKDNKYVLYSIKNIQTQKNTAKTPKNSNPLLLLLIPITTLTTILIYLRNTRG
ncbi:MAG: lamin tail domain-containing protein, partial [Candidatus Peregrinibacteria bacterium]